MCWCGTHIGAISPIIWCHVDYTKVIFFKKIIKSVKEKRKQNKNLCLPPPSLLSILTQLTSTSTNLSRSKFLTSLLKFLLWRNFQSWFAVGKSLTLVGNMIFCREGFCCRIVYGESRFIRNRNRGLGFWLAMEELQKTEETFPWLSIASLASPLGLLATLSSFRLEVATSRQLVIVGSGSECRGSGWG